MPFALSVDSWHKVGTASSFGTCHAWTPQVAEAGANRSNPRQAHPPCGFRAHVLFGLSLSLCPDECAPSSSASFGWGADLADEPVWSWEGREDALGPGSGRRYPGQRPGTGQGWRWSGMGVQLAFWRRCLVHEAALTPLPGTAAPPSSPPKQGVISVRHSLFAAQVPSFALHGDFGGASLTDLPFIVQC